MSDRKRFTENQKQIIFKSCDFLNIHAQKYSFLLQNAFAIKQDVKRAFGYNAQLSFSN